MPGEGVELGPPMTLEQVKQTRHPSVLGTAREREQPLTQFGTTLAEAHTLVTYLALTGVVYPLASVMPELPPERVNLLKMTLPPLPIFPMDLYSRGTDMQFDRFKYTTANNYIHNYPELLDLKVNAASGIYDVVGVTNWRSEVSNKRVSFEQQLGLSSGSYLVFDFWNQKFLGAFDGSVDVKVLPHDTQVLLIHPAVGHPQLLGTARHISGSYSINAMGWEEAASRLRGRSTTIAGEPYTIWVHVPKEFRLSTAHATGGKGEVPVKAELHGELLTLTIPGQESPGDWDLAFSNEHVRKGE